MKNYTGTKAVKAIPMNLGDYNEYRGWKIPKGENPADAGYLVEDQRGGEPNHPEHESYITWTPAEVFEASFVEDSVIEVAPVEEIVVTTWQDRVRAEAAELADKLSKLRAFIAKTQLRIMPLIEQQDLLKQAKAMSTYLDILNSRISRF